MVEQILLDHLDPEPCAVGVRKAVRARDHRAGRAQQLAPVGAQALPVVGVDGVDEAAARGLVAGPAADARGGRARVEHGTRRVAHHDPVVALLDKRAEAFFALGERLVEARALALRGAAIAHVARPHGQAVRRRKQTVLEPAAERCGVILEYEGTLLHHRPPELACGKRARFVRTDLRHRTSEQLARRAADERGCCRVDVDVAPVLVVGGDRVGNATEDLGAVRPPADRAHAPPGRWRSARRRIGARLRRLGAAFRRVGRGRLLAPGRVMLLIGHEDKIIAVRSSQGAATS